jgi:nucleoid-associated protein YejK
MAGPPDAARYAQAVEELRALEEEFNEFRESSRQLEAELEQVPFSDFLSF